MGRITVVCTRHEELGKCNSSELLRIIESIKPDVFFEELSVSNFDRAYNQNSLVTLESSAIKLYRKDNNVIQVPVDTYPLSRNHEERVHSMYARLTTLNTEDSYNFRSILDQQVRLAEVQGFSFLNSGLNDDLFMRMDSLKEKMLMYLDDERLNDIHTAEINVINERENEMLKNIYAFATNSIFGEAMMFIGSAHRRTIFPLIEKFHQGQEINIEWRNYFN